MSLPLPARRLVQTARSATTSSPSLHLRYLLPSTQKRHASWNPFSWGKSSKPKQDPLSLELTRRENEQKIYKRMSDRTSGDSIFEDEIQDAERRNEPEGEGATKASMAGYELSNIKEHKMRALDPDPRWRVRWQRRQVMQMVRNGGKKLSKDQQIRLVEKDLTFQSENMETSMKKLVHLAHQIAGKPIEEAITQMRYTKKKTGKQLVYYLEEARDRAIVSRGMGLGKANGQTFAEPKQIQTKDGKWMEVSDPTQLYVDQAWVGKGPWRGYRIRYHARGRSSAMWHPSTHINFVLKEEKTRIRQHQERVDKQAKAKPWVHLPNRPVTAQRQHYSW
ncbi:mitochondrial 54S ribosomal protein uL22m [Apiospora kogelbergensis]|uniref:Mitochondrial large ribosomal subunit n=1 Tax=Apiospora kogelbergensis TaxID=1337665 RepID=A0AAW0R041_9PEZI